MASSLALIALWGVFQMTRVAGDDPDPGRQRPGILDLGDLPDPAPEIDGLPSRGRRSVVFFVAPDDARRLCIRLDEQDALKGDEVVVISTELPQVCSSVSHPFRMDPASAARAFGVPAPRGNVPPSGYVIVDSSARIRYRTIDPDAAELLDEVATMLRAVR
jgi:hypothetical protein